MGREARGFPLLCKEEGAVERDSTPPPSPYKGEDNKRARGQLRDRLADFLRRRALPAFPIRGDGKVIGLAAVEIRGTTGDSVSHVYGGSIFPGRSPTVNFIALDPRVVHRLPFQLGHASSAA